VPLGEPQTRRHLETLRTCSSIMEGIVSDMLDFERIDSGRMTLVHRPFSLERLFADAQITFTPLCARKGVALDFEPLPESVATKRFVGDARRLLQCVSNGLSNANKFCDPGGKIRVRAWRTAHARDGWARVHIAIIDDGIGLDASELRTLQAGGAFAQVGRGQLQGNGGTGLGLTIVRHILKLHHGSELSIYSKGHRQGTTFELIVSMPLATREDEAAGRSVALSPLPSSRTRSPPTGTRSSTALVFPLDSPGAVAQPVPEPVRCLHVEDDMMLQLSVQARLFSRHNVPCDVANHGQEALELCAQRVAAGNPPYAFVLMDNQMPTMSGAVATRMLRSQGFEGRIIGMTGDPPGSTDREEFENAGLDECVDKTPEGLELVERYLLEHVVGRRDARKG